MKPRTLTWILPCLLALAVGYLLGTGSNDLERDAFAGPYWDPDAKAYVTDSGNVLYFWKIDGTTVKEVVAWEAGFTPAQYETSSTVDQATGLTKKHRKLKRKALPMIFKEKFAPAPKGERPASARYRGGSACASGGKACG